MSERNYNHLFGGYQRRADENAAKAATLCERTITLSVRLDERIQAAALMEGVGVDEWVRVALSNAAKTR